MLISLFCDYTVILQKCSFEIIEIVLRIVCIRRRKIGLFSNRTIFCMIKVIISILRVNHVFFSKVVWDETEEIGCAVAFCPNPSGLDERFRNSNYLVCNYGPA